MAEMSPMMKQYQAIKAAYPDTILFFRLGDFYEMFNEDALGRLIQQFLTQFYLDNETNANQADFLARSYLFEGDIRAVARFEEQLRGVTPLDIQRMAQRFIRDVRWIYIGDGKRAPVKAFEKF